MANCVNWLRSLVHKVASWNIRRDHRTSTSPPDRPPLWQEFEYFDEAWQNRIRLMAGFIQPKSCVMDLGCGQLWLKNFLAGCKYIPVDYTKRDAETIVCDFNKYQFPDRDVDCAFVSGCLEYVIDVEWFIGKIAEQANSCILSYCTIEKFPSISARESLGWQHNLTALDIERIFKSKGMRLTHMTETETKNTIFVFEKSDDPRTMLSA